MSGKPKPNVSAELPAYQAKVNILKQIDDAASQFGGKSTRNAGAMASAAARNDAAKMAAQMVLGSQRNSNVSGLKGSDLEKLDFNHGKTLLDRASKAGSKAPEQKEDLRSLKSEYDYGAKRKFVDVLGNVKKANGLEGLKDHPGAKNMEAASVRSQKSKLSSMSSVKRRYNSIATKNLANGVEPINEEQAEGQLFSLTDKQGNVVHLTEEQLKLLEVLSNQQNLANMTEKQQEILKNIKMEDLQMMDSE